MPKQTNDQPMLNKKQTNARRSKLERRRAQGKRGEERSRLERASEKGSKQCEVRNLKPTRTAARSKSLRPQERAHLAPIKPRPKPMLSPPAPFCGAGPAKLGGGNEELAVLDCWEIHRKVTERTAKRKLVGRVGPRRRRPQGPEREQTTNKQTNQTN